MREKNYSRQCKIDTTICRDQSFSVVQTCANIQHSVLQKAKNCLKLTTKLYGETLFETECSFNTEGLLYTVNRCLCLQVACPATSLQVGTANYLDMGNSNHSHLQSNSPAQSRHKRRGQARRGQERRGETIWWE